MPPRKRLGQLLVELKIIDEHQLQSALGHQKQWGGKLGFILVQKGFCREDQVVTALSQHLAMPVVKLNEVKVDLRAVKTVARSVAEKLHVFAYEVTGSGRSEVVTVAMGDPTDLSAIDQLAFHTGKRIKPMLAGDTEVVSAIARHYGDVMKPGAPAGAQARPTPAAMAPAPMQSGTPSAGVARVAGAGGAAAAAASLHATPPEPPVDAGIEDLPSDAPVEGLEPIAAHTQRGEQIEGSEDVAGVGEAADPVDGLEAANPADGAGAVDVEAMAELESTSPPGADAAAEAMEALPLEDPAALQGWAEGPPKEGVDWSDDSPVPADELPADAILGTPQAEAAAGADAPPAWNDADPLAAGAADAWGAPTDTVAGDAEPAGLTPPADADDADVEVTFDESSVEEPAPPADDEQLAAQVHAAAESYAAAESGEGYASDAGAGEAGADRGAFPPSGDQPADAPLGEEQSTGADWQQETGAEEPAAEEYAAQEQLDPQLDPTAGYESAANEEPPADGYAAEEQQPRDEYAPASNDSAQQEHAASEGDPAFDEFAIEDQHATEADAGGEQPAGDGYAQDPAGADAAMDANVAAEGSWEQGAETYAPEERTARLQFARPADDESVEPQGAPAEEWAQAPAQGAWFGDAGALSAADLGTLQALGIDPGDVAGALRALACLVRLLNRRQAIDLDELAAEIRESRDASAEAAPADPGEAPPENRWPES